MKYRGRIFLLDDDELIITMLSRSLRSAGYETTVQTTAVNALDNISAWHPDLTLLDIHLDNGANGLDILGELARENIDTMVVMLTADDTAESAITAMKLGAADYLTKPFNVEEVQMVVQGLLEKARLKDELEYLRKDRTGSGCEDMVGRSAIFNSIRNRADKLASAGAQTILITGESGTGKEVLARYIHHCGSIHRQTEQDNLPFIAVNCTALPANLIESELFGHTKYAFTDARSDKKGMFELANGGTILLDEIGDMQFDLQSKLLRVLEDHKVRRLGGNADIPLELSVIVTTNKDLRKAVRRKEFRDDLYYRLSTFNIELPPLRERVEDIAELADYFLVFFSKKYQKKAITALSTDTLKVLSSYSWPGNIRELKNVIERCVVLEDEQSIYQQYLTQEKGRQQFVERPKANRLILTEKGLSLEELEKDLIAQALRLTDGNQAKAARLLGLSYDTLRYQVKKFDLH
jgi:DNA-binding NtrC family response regulator